MKIFKLIIPICALSILSTLSFANIHGFSEQRIGNHYILKKANKCADIPTNGKTKQIKQESVISWNCKNADWQKWNKISPSSYRNVQHPQCIFSPSGLNCDTNSTPTTTTQTTSSSTNTNSKTIQGFTAVQTGDVYELHKDGKCADIPTNATSQKIIIQKAITWNCKNVDWQKWKYISDNEYQNVQHPQCSMKNTGFACNTTNTSTTPNTSTNNETPSQNIPGLHPDIVYVKSVKGANPGSNWADSYSANGKCYCISTFDHAEYIDGIPYYSGVKISYIKEQCAKNGAGPGQANRPLYNDIQCGNGPYNNAPDEALCPGRVDIGSEGCGQIGPKW